MESLFLLVSPVDRPSTEMDDVFWAKLKSVLETFAVAGHRYERIEMPTQEALERPPGGKNWDVVHFVTHSQERETSAYGAIELISPERFSRFLPAQLFAQLLASYPLLRLVVLQARGSNNQSFETVAEALIAKGIPNVIWTSPLPGATGEIFMRELHLGLLDGQSAEQLSQRFARLNLLSEDGRAARISVHAENMDAPVIPTERRAVLALPGQNPQTAQPSPPSGVTEAMLSFEKTLTAPAAPELDKEALQLRRKLKQLRRQNLFKEIAFDVFLCHNSKDKQFVKETAVGLMRNGILPWLDEWEQAPGTIWVRELSEQVLGIHCAVVFIGAGQIGKWQEREIHRILDRTTSIIPVFLPDVPIGYQLPDFLSNMHWVDFRSPVPDPLQQLIWGITKRHPDDE